MAELERVRIWAEALIALHLDPEQWSFGFDNAKTRAGLCNYTSKRITVSRYLAERYEDDEIHQVLLHEVAHAIAGHDAGHGARWQQVADELGYEGGRLHHGAIASELAPWVGSCPAGHTHYRYRRPSRPLSCGICARGFSRRSLIAWRQQRTRGRIADRTAERPGDRSGERIAASSPERSSARPASGHLAAEPR